MAEMPTHATMVSSVSAGAFEECASIAEIWRCAVPFDCSDMIRKRTERQNKVATEIAAAIRARAKYAEPQPVTGELSRAAEAVLKASIADLEFGLLDALEDHEPVRESLFGEWKSALRVGDLRRLRAALSVSSSQTITKGDVRERIARIICAAVLDGQTDGEDMQNLVDGRWHAYLPEADAILAIVAPDTIKHPINTAPLNEEVFVYCGEMRFRAKLVPGASMTMGEEPCDQWQATREGEHPPCWSDGCCWASNENENASLQPTHWSPAPSLSPEPATQHERTSR